MGRGLCAEGRTLLLITIIVLANKYRMKSGGFSRENVG